MQSGRLNRRITIQQRTATHDALGQPLETWSAVATIWADIRHPSGIETVKAAADISIVKASIRIRFRSDITADMRVAHGADIYNIKAVLPDHAGREYLDLICERVS